MRNVWKNLSLDDEQCVADVWECGNANAACVGATGANAALGGSAQWAAQTGTRVDTRSGATTNLGARCVDLAGNPVTPDGTPIVITVTQRDFASLPVAPAVAHAGPPAGYLPVNMDLIAYAEPREQTLDTVLLGTPVQVRATPVEYTWDFGDGNTLTTHTPGRPYPAKDLTHRYTHEGWYDITLTTTYTGQFSVNGGPWQDINGTITVASQPVALYSRSFESHLVNPDTTPDDIDDTELPPRTPENQGPPS